MRRLQKMELDTKKTARKKAHQDNIQCFVPVNLCAVVDDAYMICRMCLG